MAMKNSKDKRHDRNRDSDEQEMSQELRTRKSGEVSNAPQTKRGSVPETPGAGRKVLSVLKKIFAALLVSAAVVTLIVNYAFPVMRIYGSSMSATLIDGDIVIAQKTAHIKQGDICAFYTGSRILCKRVVGVGGDEIKVDKDGTVFVNGKELDEPYVKAKTLGDGDVDYPVKVPRDSYFVLGDNRRTSVDSRYSVIGCVSSEQVVGKLLFCILPLPSFGRID